MKGDFTRSTFDPEKQYNGVRLQQGRVLLDSDFNVHVDIQAYLSQTEAVDVIGACGAPQGNAGFEIGVTDDNQDLTISPGRFYVDGILCELAVISTAIEDFIDEATILVSAIQVDSHRFEPDQWVAIESNATEPQIAQISEVNAEERQVTFVEPIASIDSEAQPTIRILVLYSTQPDYPDSESETLAAGTYLAYLDVWQRHITALEDPTIREVALGGPDTTTRTKTICQVKLFRVGDLGDNTLNCLSDFEAWEDTIAPSSGQMRARAEAEIDETELCLVPAQAGYRGLENQLYRVEIHNVNSETEITIKWSRENGSVVAAWTGQDELQKEKLTISNPGRDAVLGFGPDQWIELTDDVRELKGLPGTLVKVLQVDGSVLTIGTDTVDFEADFSLGHNPKIRRWDMPGDSAGEITVDLTDDEAWIALENGIEVKFEAGRYHTGDYWLIPARTATGDIEWPRDANTGEALAQLPHGITHHYCRLALLRYNGDTWSDRVEDCRPAFPPLTEMTRFFYIGGNGQEAMPGNPLPQRLRVGVMNGPQPVVGRTVRFTALEAGGRVADTVADLPAATSALDTMTNESGVASCVWQLQNNPNTPSQLVTAVLLDAAGNPTGHPPLAFNANLSIARQVAYEPGECAELAEATTVQQALDILCNFDRGGEPEDEGVHIETVIFNSGEQLLNDVEFPANLLASGLQIICDDIIAQNSVQGKPVCYVTLDLPYPFSQDEMNLWGNALIGFQPLILAADVNSDNNVIFWNPTSETASWLVEQLFPMMAEFGRGERVLAHLTLKGNFIWAAEDPDRFLDGDIFGVEDAGLNRTALRFPSGNGRRGGDFEMWFWLTQ